MTGLSGPRDGAMWRNGHAMVPDGQVENLERLGYHRADPHRRPSVGGVPLVGGPATVPAASPEPVAKKPAAKKAAAKKADTGDE